MAVYAIVNALDDAKMGWRQIEAMVAGSYMFVAEKEGCAHISFRLHPPEIAMLKLLVPEPNSDMTYYFVA